ncbi:CXADR-like membrane protein [Orbicella faveolata]|uniref:CXADR-like membrane protein n=1 Tax=Orbicella faveolata TaxID=48498 RepID=UPI0009E5B787|nr:CXADR-like membrane protein [Orbicella faveolata]
MWGTGTEGEMAIKKGERLSLQCETENTTFAHITWYKDDEPLPVQRSFSRNMISIPEITGNDFGVYECKAQNALGVTSMKMRVINAKLLTSMKVAVGCLAALCFLFLVVIGVLVWLLIKAKKTKASEDDEKPDEKSPVKPAGPRPSDSDFKIPEAHATGSPGMVASHGSNSSYIPLKSGSSNGGTSQTYRAT